MDEPMTDQRLKWIEYWLTDGPGPCEGDWLDIATELFEEVRRLRAMSDEMDLERQVRVLEQKLAASRAIYSEAEALEARVAELEAELANCASWLEEGETLQERDAGARARNVVRAQFDRRNEG